MLGHVGPSFLSHIDHQTTDHGKYMPIRSTGPRLPRVHPLLLPILHTASLLPNAHLSLPHCKNFSTIQITNVCLISHWNHTCRVSLGFWSTARTRQNPSVTSPRFCSVAPLPCPLGKGK